MKHVQRKSKPYQSRDRTRVDERVTWKSEEGASKEGTTSVSKEQRVRLKIRGSERTSTCARFGKKASNIIFGKSFLALAIKHYPKPS